MSVSSFPVAATKLSRSTPAERSRLAKLPRAVVRDRLTELAGALRELLPLVGPGFSEEVAVGPVRVRIDAIAGPAPGPGCRG